MDLWEKFKEWSASETKSARTTRTLFHNVIGVIVAFLPDIVAGTTVIPVEMKPFVLALANVILAPIQKAIGESGKEE